MVLDSSAEYPLYKQLTEIIRREIDKGTYRRGEKIPTEKELSTIYNVSRITVRAALEELTKENLLVRRQGKGTFVSNEKLVRGIGGIRSFSDSCRRIGCEPGAKVIKCAIEDAAPSDLEDLELEAGTKIIAIERIRYADKVPVSFEISHFPEQFSFLLQEDLNNCSMFDIIENKYGIVFEQSRKVLELAFANYEMSKYLDIAQGYPLLYISSVTCDTQGTPAHRSKQFIVGDKFKLVV